MRETLVDALAALDAQLPWRVPVIVAGERRDEPTLLSHDPGAPERIVAEATTATTADVDAAVRAAGVAAPAWEDRGAHARAAILSRAAGELRRRRATLAALAVRECAKPWAEADADVCEAIDFLEYYAQQAVALEGANGLVQLPGRAQHAALRGPRRRGRDRPVELPAGDPRRDGRGRAGDRQRRRAQARRAVPGVRATRSSRRCTRPASRPRC